MKIALLAILLLPAMAAAQDYSLPLAGNYRLGRYMPVQFPSQPGELRLSAVGAATTVIQSHVAGIAPFLIFSSPLQNSPFSQPLHELQPDEKLVGIATDAPDIASVLFPGAKIISISLDPVHPIPGPVSAWQSLDALVLDVNSPQLRDPAILNLLSGGTIIAIGGTTTAPNFAGVTQRLDHGFWILEPPPCVSAAASDDSYAPVEGLQPTVESSYRQHVLLMGVIVALVVIAASLWRSRLSWVVAALLVVFAVGGIPMWDNFHSPITAEMGVILVNGTNSMADRWIYEWSRKPVEAQLHFPGSAWPMVPEHGNLQNMTLVCSASGDEVSYHFHLEPDHPAAFVYREPRASIAAGDLTNPIDSPLATLVGSHYPGYLAIGQTIPPPTREKTLAQWPTVVLAKSDAMPTNLSPASGRDSSNK